MSIKNISEAMWPEIVRLEAEAYREIEPESLDALRSKWLVSPELCFVFEVNKEIAGYLLAHQWGSLEPPKLFKPLPKNSGGQYLFIHDLVVSKKYSGIGLGQKLVNNLLQSEHIKGLEKVLLVSVQDSQNFWSKLKFVAIGHQQVDECYGDTALIMQRVINLK